MKKDSQDRGRDVVDARCSHLEIPGSSLGKGFGLRMISSSYSYQGVEGSSFYHSTKSSFSLAAVLHISFSCTLLKK
jgi:uncharacterized membrane protein